MDDRTVGLLVAADVEPARAGLAVDVLADAREIADRPANRRAPRGWPPEAVGRQRELRVGDRDAAGFRDAQVGTEEKVAFPLQAGRRGEQADERPLSARDDVVRNQA